VAGLPVLAGDAHRVYLGLTTGWGLAALLVTVAAGTASVVLVLRSAFPAARLVAAAAVAALLLGWAAAQRPYLLPGLTPGQAASGTATLIALSVAVLLGGALLAPSLVWLFGLTLTGRFDRDQPVESTPIAAPATSPRVGPARRLRAALASLVVGVVFLTVLDGGAAHVIGVLALAAAAVAGFAAVDPTQIGEDRRETDELRCASGDPTRRSPFRNHRAGSTAAARDLAREYPRPIKEDA
jgi:cytochrome d ubiquinol oxidase subunit II